MIHPFMSDVDLFKISPHARPRDWARKLCRKARLRAEAKGLDFDLTPEWILENAVNKCPVLGVELISSSNNNYYQCPSLDRLNNDLGYTRDNVAIISYRANVLKRDATLEELKSLVTWLETMIANKSQNIA